jgi:hypothetical protein
MLRAGNYERRRGMAQKVNEFPKVDGRGRPTVHPWDKWFDGAIWELKSGEDFQATTKSMRKMTSDMGARKGFQVKTSVVGDVLYVQATPRNNGA